MNQPSARAQTSAPAQAPKWEPQAEGFKETTYFWHPEHDAEICREWVRTHYPDTRARVVFILPTHRLTERTHVIALVRKKPSATNKWAFEQGRRMEVPRPMEELLDEVVEGRAVAVKPFISGATEWEDGALSAEDLIDRLSKDFNPAVCHYRKDDGKAHLFGA